MSYRSVTCGFHRAVDEEYSRVESVAMLIRNLFGVVKECRFCPQDGGRKRLRKVGNKLRINWSSYLRLNMINLVTN